MRLWALQRLYRHKKTLSRFYYSKKIISVGGSGVGLWRAQSRAGGALLMAAAVTHVPNYSFKTRPLTILLILRYFTVLYTHKLACLCFCKNPGIIQ